MAGEGEHPGDPQAQDESTDSAEAGKDIETETANGDGPDGSEYGPKLSQVSVESTEEENLAPSLPYPVVGIGASAGGLTAFQQVLEKLKPDTGMAFVLVTHMSPDHKSYLTEILERHTKIPVKPVVDGERPEPNHLYVLQPEQRLTLRGGAFHVEERQPGHRPLIIDTFFRSLAAEQKNHAIGVVLSGADSDGAAGLKAIKGEGGIALVQSPESAAQPSMPQSSIAADHVDLVVPPAELALELGRLSVQFSRPEVRSLEEGLAAAEDEPSFQRILQLLRSTSGLDLRQYKPETLRRRMARRLLLVRKNSLAEYYRFLQIRPEELRLLQEDLLISVTRFFRDPGFWESLRENVLPQLLRDRPADRPVRVWCAGCSTGEEAYSLAIVLIEYLSANNLETTIQVFGTDVSERSIETARLAVYPETLADEISPDRLRRFFVKMERGYQVSKRVRDTCIFARQNLCNDPPFSHIDVLSCRNVMIYFNPVLQRQIMMTFHYALEPGGYMLLGMSEGLRDYADLFSAVDRKHKIYTKTAVSLPQIYDMPQSERMGQTSGLGAAVLPQSESHIWPELELQRAADRIVLARFGPPGLVVDERLHVLQARGQTAPYVEIASGGVSWSLLRVLKEGIAAETRDAVERAIRENVPTTATATVIDDEKGEQKIQIDVLPITSVVARPRCFLVLFQQSENDQPRLTEQDGTSKLTVDEKSRLIAQLRHDLGSMRFHLQSLIEERDARNQELMSANEEIQSGNEELQSTNEELETTKEELQSAVEELQTVNEELQQRNNALAQTGNDLNNLLNSVNIPVLMLTNDLHIRQFTPPMQKLLNVRATDIGRPVSDIRLQMTVDDISPMLHEVMETLAPREAEVQDKEGRWYLLRVRPYRTSENKIEGLVVVFVDIDQLRKTQQQALEAHHFASAVVEGVPAPIVVLNEDFAIRTANTAFRDLSGLSGKELDGRLLPNLVKLLWGIDGLHERLENLLEDPESKLEFEHESRTGQKRILLMNGQVLTAGGRRVILLMIDDITVRRKVERLMSKQKDAMQTEIDEAASTLSRAKDQLRGLTNYLFHVQEEERQRVARELHDDVSQRLSFLEMLLSDVSAGQIPEECAKKIESARNELQGLNTDVREMSHRLHPKVLKDLGLPAALRGLIEEFDRREGMPATFSSRHIPESVRDEAATAIYRITQEALRNVAKHAGRTHVKVALHTVDHALELKVKDFGVGFDTEAADNSDGLGLISMQERARMAGGSFAVDSELGAGTTITVRVPLE